MIRNIVLPAPNMLMSVFEVSDSSVQSDKLVSRSALGRRSPRWTLVRYVLLAVASLPASALALVGGAGVAPNSYDSPWSGVGSLSVNGSKFTATLIAPGYVLTAAHVASGQDPSKISFQVNAGSSYAVVASQDFVNPGYTGGTGANVIGDPTKHADLAIIKLSTEVGSGLPYYKLFSGDLQGKGMTFVSYAGSSSAKTTGENVVDVLFADVSGTQQTYLFDFDGPDLSTNRLGANIQRNGTLGSTREASLVGGDSGSAAFVMVGGQWQLAGVNTFEAKFSSGPTTSGSFGTGGGGVILSSYSPWINSIVLTPVPEPTTWLMLLAGLGLVGSLSRGRNVEY